jgi:hypothetical protein
MMLSQQTLRLSPRRVAGGRALQSTILLAFTAGMMFMWSAQTSAQDESKRVAKPQAKRAAVKKAAAPVFDYPPRLSNGKTVVTVTGPELIQRPGALLDGVAMAQTPPVVDFAFYPGQDYEGHPWSNWGDSLFAQGKYYSAIGDHLAPQGNAFVYEFDPDAKLFRLLTDVRKLIDLPDGHYTPGKIHSRLGLGRDGWLYFSTHRGSTRVTTPENHYTGDWLLRANPSTGQSEIIARGPVPNHCLPNGLLDAERLIFYGGTAPGQGGDDEGIQFFAYDLANRKMLYSGPDGPSRAILLAKSTGKVYFTPKKGDTPLMRFDPASPAAPVEIPGELGLRACTDETRDGKVYTVSFPQREGGTQLYAFDVRTERVTPLGPAAAGTNQYIASLKADPSGRYLYYVPGAHGGSDKDGSAVVQYDLRTGKKKVLCCLHPVFEQKFGIVLKGTYAVAVDDQGERLFVTWNISRGSKAWDCCGVTVIHIPASERPL